MNQVATVEQNQIQPFNPGHLLEMAVQKDFDVAKLKELMGLQREWQKEEAKADFLSAMTRFQLNMPEIRRTKKAHNSKYAPLEHIISAIKEELASCMLSYRWEVVQNGSISVTCIISHVAGHSERTTMSADRDESGNKNAIQALGSADTYLKRYTLISALGITTADEDDDGNASGMPLMEKRWNKLLKHNAVLADWLASVDVIKIAIQQQDYSTAAEAIGEMGHEVFTSLWVAPSYGGIWTTAEREAMKEPDFKQAMLDAGVDMSGN